MFKNVHMLFFVALLGCSSIQGEEKDNNYDRFLTGRKSVGDEMIITNKALESFKSEYLKAPLNRAFAQSESGAWNWRSDRTTIEFAKSNALIACQRNNAKSEDTYPCKIIHVNDEWIE